MHMQSLGNVRDDDGQKWLPFMFCPFLQNFYKYIYKRIMMKERV
jgi:hypothetical protein